MKTAPDKPTLVFDGDCGFCRFWIARWKVWTGEKVEYVPYQSSAGRFPQIPKADFEQAVQLVDVDGRVYKGAEAVFRSLATNPRRRWPLRLYRGVPGFKAASETVYGLVARHRQAASRATLWLWGRQVEPPTYRLARFLFVRSVAAIFLLAFLSLGPQLEGLMGDRGILPASGLLKSAEVLGASRFLELPTLCWLGGGGPFLHVLCGIGAVASIGALAGFAIGPFLLLAWACYLSLATVGLDFLSFQWDNLLLEAGFLAAFYAPWRLRSSLKEDPEPPRWIRFVLLFLLFKLMLQSGAVKLLSGDPTWRSLTALDYHYETQPLPTWLGWFAHLLPEAFQRFSVALVFAIELGGPFLMLGPRNLRRLALAGFVLLQVLILLTGNYCFFNLLTLALCLLLVEDSVWGRPYRPVREARTAGERLRTRLLGTLAAAVFALSFGGLLSTFLGARALPGPLRTLEALAGPWRTVNNYGLFAVMTTTRDEIVVEGSDDAVTWKAYEFKWKPGDVRRRPGFVEPHQPRLDWQMWFAALGSYRENPWFVNFVLRLLEGSPPVLGLLANNPFPNAPPKYIRSTLFRYHFSDWRTLRSEGAWWTREERGPYTPGFGLR